MSHRGFPIPQVNRLQIRLSRTTMPKSRDKTNTKCPTKKSSHIDFFTLKQLNTNEKRQNQQHERSYRPIVAPPIRTHIPNRDSDALLGTPFEQGIYCHVFALHTCRIWSASDRLLISLQIRIITRVVCRPRLSVLAWGDVWDGCECWLPARNLHTSFPGLHPVPHLIGKHLVCEGF